MVERQHDAGQLSLRRQPAELRVGHDPAARIGDGFGDERTDDTGRSVSVPAEPGRACRGRQRAVGTRLWVAHLRARASAGGTPIPGPGIIATALAFLLGAFAFGGWRKQR